MSSLQVFISYSRRDKHLLPYVKEAIIAEEQVTPDFLIDEELLSPGQPKMWLTLLQKVQQADCVAFVWSVHAAQSGWVQVEKLYALVHVKKILPIITDTEPLPAELADFVALDLRPHLPRGIRLWRSHGRNLLALSLLVLCGGVGWVSKHVVSALLLGWALACLVARPVRYSRVLLRTAGQSCASPWRR